MLVLLSRALQFQYQHPAAVHVYRRVEDILNTLAG